jgi:hypothetical protein
MVSVDCPGCARTHHARAVDGTPRTSAFADPGGSPRTPCLREQAGDGRVASDLGNPDATRRRARSAEPPRPCTASGAVGRQARPISADRPRHTRRFPTATAIHAPPCERTGTTHHLARATSGAMTRPAPPESRFDVWTTPSSNSTRNTSTPMRQAKTNTRNVRARRCSKGSSAKRPRALWYRLVTPTATVSHERRGSADALTTIHTHPHPDHPPMPLLTTYNNKRQAGRPAPAPTTVTTQRVRGGAAIHNDGADLPRLLFFSRRHTSDFRVLDFGRSW